MPPQWSGKSNTTAQTLAYDIHHGDERKSNQKSYTRLLTRGECVVKRICCLGTMAISLVFISDFGYIRSTQNVKPGLALL